MARIPTEEECNALLDKYEVPQHIRDHMAKVSKVAEFLTKKLKENGVDIDIDLVVSASKLHDIAKLKNKDKTHEETGKDILEKEGFHEVASLVARHGFVSALNDELHTWEEKVVCYADKRVTHDKIVSLEERYDYGHKTYTDKSGRREEGEQKLRKLEKEITTKAGIDPADIKE